MKWFIGILGFTAALTGYMKYPSLRYQLTGLSQIVPVKPAATKAADVAVAAPSSPPLAAPPAAVAPAAAPLATTPPIIDLTKLTPAQLPAQVTLKVSTEVGDASGLKMKIDPGSRLTLVRVEGDQVVVSPGSSPFEGRVAVSGTDLMEQLEAKPPVAPADPPPAVASPATDPAPPAVQPEPTPAATIQEPATAVVPAAEPAPSQAPAASSTDVVEVMKEHLRSGAIKEFKFEQVLEWKAAPDEVLGGASYQTGLVRYSTDTIFGVKTIEAKALMQAGKVVRWVWPKNPSMEIN